MVDKCAEAAKKLMLSHKKSMEINPTKLSYSYKASKLTGYFVRVSLSRSFKESLYANLESIRDIYLRDRLHKYVKLRKDESKVLHYLLKEKRFSVRVARKYLQIRSSVKPMINKVGNYLYLMIQHFISKAGIST